MELWVIISMIIVLLVVGVAVYALKKDREYEPDYRVFFILGITWLPLGIATDNTAFLGMGAVFMVLGLTNRDKWREQPKWSEMEPGKRKIKLSIIIGLTVFLVVAILALLFTK